jgi:hypothetical protein
MDQIGERWSVAARIEAPDVVGGPRAHHRQQPVDRLQDAGDTPERQRARAEPDDLAIVRPIESPDDLNGIGG